MAVDSQDGAQDLRAPFPYFGCKRKAVDVVWPAFGAVKNYVEPFASSCAMLLGAPAGERIETINDFDGFVANFWRAVAQEPEAVAHHADWPVSELDLHARHSWLVRQRRGLTDSLLACPDFFDAKIAGWWLWGACCWIGSGWCSGEGPWVHDGLRLVDGRNSAPEAPAAPGALGITRSLPKLSSGGSGIMRKLPHLGDAGRGVTGARRAFIAQWLARLAQRLARVRVACGDWRRVLGPAVTSGHGLTAVFLDPPYAQGDMDYGAGGMGLDIAQDVRAWCAAHGDNPLLRIVLCGHAGEHDALLAQGWQLRRWRAGSGYARASVAYESEALWCSPHCVPEQGVQTDLFAA